MDSYLLTVFYDGQCSACNKTMDFYKERDVQNKICFIDIHSSSFPFSERGLDQKKLNQALHVINAHGKVSTGVDAFYLIWEVLNVFSFMRWLIRIPPLKPCFSLGYYCFAYFIRPFFRKHRHLRP